MWVWDLNSLQFARQIRKNITELEKEKEKKEKKKSETERSSDNATNSIDTYTHLRLPNTNQMINTIIVLKPCVFHAAQV